MSSVALLGISKSFGHVQVIRPLNLEVAAGEFLVLVGPSGCGKSTLLRIIAGLETASSGAIQFGDKDVSRLSPKERGIAMVFQNYALYPHMSVRANIEFSLKLSSIPSDEIERRVVETARVLNLTEHLDKKPGQLSGGQKQRVAIGRAIVRKPKVFLFDEPLSNLDAQLRVQMRSEIAQLHRRIGATSVYVTHDQVEAMTLADRIAVFNGGVVEQIGAPLDVYRFPATRFVASFIGTPSMNFLPASFFSADCLAHGAVEVGFRPEECQIDPDGGQGLVTIGRGRVLLKEPLGQKAHIHLLLAEKHPLICEALASDQFSVDSEVEVAVNRQALFFFDAAGKAIYQS